MFEREDFEVCGCISGTHPGKARYLGKEARLYVQALTRMGEWQVSALGAMIIGQPHLGSVASHFTLSRASQEESNQTSLVVRACVAFAVESRDVPPTLLKNGKEEPLRRKLNFY